MKKKLIALLIAVAMLASLLAACAVPVESGEPDPAPVPEPPVTLPGDLTRPMPPVEGGNPDEAKAAIANFSQALFREVMALGEENPVISPLSAYYALAMVALGARGETRAEFEALLGRNPEALARDLYTLTRQLMDNVGSTQINIAGSVWVYDDVTIDPDFAQAMAQYFDALAESRDFRAQATVDEINAWVAARTEGLIEELIQEIGEDEVMLLINTLYFSAKWAEAFNPMTEVSGTFYPENGVALEVPFLSASRQPFAVSVTDTYEAIMLPYDDDRLGFLLVRPTDGRTIRDFVAAHDLGEIIAGLAVHDDVQVRMPKLDLEFEVSLDELLQSLGLRLAFGADGNPDLSGLLVRSEEDLPLRISRVLQKVRLLVDEEGTEAAAATVIGIEPMSLPLVTLTFNTPYLYAIYDLETGIPLFMGVLDNPA